MSSFGSLERKVSVEDAVDNEDFEERRENQEATDSVDEAVEEDEFVHLRVKRVD